MIQCTRLNKMVALSPIGGLRILHFFSRVTIE